ncbi:MAG TPA: hypothetical protein VFV27_03940 [Nevskiaceae bacterium]|nr:hypothetical protein [Nevskiaceae bacterium]
MSTRFPRLFALLASFATPTVLMAAGAACCVAGAACCGVGMPCCP